MRTKTRSIICLGIKKIIFRKKPLNMSVLIKTKSENQLKMRGVICSRLSRALYSASSTATSNPSEPLFDGGSVIARALITTWTSTESRVSDKADASPGSRALLSSPWSATQLRHARFSGGDVIISTSIVYFVYYFIFYEYVPIDWYSILLYLMGHSAYSLSYK